MTASRARRAAKVEPQAEAPPKRRAYLRAEERRKLIIQAAQEVFARSNLQGARTRDIAKAAAVNQATLFEHFDSKEALFVEAVVNPMLGAMRGMYERAQAYQQAGSTEEFLKLAQASTRNHLATLIEIFPLLTASLFSDAEMGRELYEEQIAPLMRVRGEVLDELLPDDIDREFAGLALFGILFAVAMNEHFKGRAGDLDDLARQVSRFAALGFLKDSYRT